MNQRSLSPRTNVGSANKPMNQRWFSPRTKVVHKDCPELLHRLMKEASGRKSTLLRVPKCDKTKATDAVTEG